MQLDEYAALDAVALAALVRRRELSAAEITAAAIAAIEALEPTLNALVLADFPRARERARGVDPDAPLAGVPFLIKDVDVHTEEWPTTNSSRFFADAKPRPDSEIVRRWRRAGTVFLGKTNTPEFADDFVTEPEFRGVTRNPWDLGRTVGGSSGGAAAAVASGMVPVAHGSDVGGSIRVPSACCGLFGLKPSRGLNPAGPHVSELGGNLNCEHVLSRSVRDSAAFLDATAGPEPGAPYRVSRAVASYLAALDVAPRPLRVVMLDRRLDGSRVDPEIEARLAEAGGLLETLGHRVVPGRFPEAASRAAAGHGWSALWLMDIAYAIHERAVELGRPPAPGEIEAFPRHALATVEAMSALDYYAARRTAHQVTLAMAQEFAEFDIILTPTLGTLPPPVGTIDSHSAAFEFERWADAAYRFAPFSEIFNVTGQPAANVPLFQSASGLPIGMQIVGRQDEDHVVLRLAAQLEEARPWKRRPGGWAGGLGA
jgi:amidase